MSYPYTALDPLDAATSRDVRLDMIFNHFKWDPQIGDVAVLADFPLALTDDAWRELSQLAEKLAAEAIAAEAELLCRPELHATLGLPGAIRRAWRDPRKIAIGSAGDVRLIRFDFHFTTDGWRISEANIDTPGGLIEASGFAQVMLAHYQGIRPVGDPAHALVTAIRKMHHPEDVIALIHATAYTDDRQMMLFLQRMLSEVGLSGCLISPAQLDWHNGTANVATEWEHRRVGHMVRFFPAEWLPNLPKASQWRPYFTEDHVPASNPTSALLVQSKRFPLTWDRLKTALPTWRALLPETRDPRTVPDAANGEWVYKPAFGRAGEDVSIRDVTAAKDWTKVTRAARRSPQEWIVQRRFEPVPLSVGGANWYPSIGVYTVNDQAAGIYARISTRPLINETAKDIAVFLKN